MPIFDDVRELTKESLRARGIERVDIIAGGYPCQPESVAGNRRSAADDRWLWPEMFRLVKAFKTDWVVGENVAGHASLALDGVLSDLETEGYEAQAFVVPACGVNAPHIRYRVFTVAHSDRDRRDGQAIPKAEGEGLSITARCVAPTTHATIKQDWRLQQREVQSDALTGLGDGRGAGFWRDGWPVSASVLCRVDDGIPNRVDRLRALGGAVAPQRVYPILKAIADYEQHSTNLTLEAQGVENC